MGTWLALKFFILRKSQQISCFSLKLNPFCFLFSGKQRRNHLMTRSFEVIWVAILQKRLGFKKYSLLTLFNANFELNNQDKNVKYGPFYWNWKEAKSSKNYILVKKIMQLLTARKSNILNVFFYLHCYISPIQ